MLNGKLNTNELVRHVGIMDDLVDGLEVSAARAGTDARATCHSPGSGEDHREQDPDPKLRPAP